MTLEASFGISVIIWPAKLSGLDLFPFFCISDCEGELLDLLLLIKDCGNF